MKTLKNINWNTERKLEQNNDNDSNISEEGWYVDFTYNGFIITAVLNFDIEFYTLTDESIDYTHTDVNSVSIDIRELYRGDEEITFPIKEVVEMQNQLAIDLKTQY